MKVLKFRTSLIKEIEDGTKTVTWRLFDDKDLSVGDNIEMVDWKTGKKFADAEITNVREKALGRIEDSDFEGHEKFPTPQIMLEQYKEYYGNQVTIETPIKMVKFKILQFTK